MQIMKIQLTGTKRTTLIYIIIPQVVLFIAQCVIFFYLKVLTCVIIAGKKVIFLYVSIWWGEGPKTVKHP